MNSSDAALAKARNQARLRRGMFILPSLFTAMNIGAGYFAITQTIAGDQRQRDGERRADAPGSGRRLRFLSPFHSIRWMGASRA